MSREDHVQLEGEVVLVAAGGNFRVKCDGGHEVFAQLAGRMRRNRIRVVLGDRVTVAVSPYDPTRGLIVFRAK
jgi:translation initiation factor IF-1